MTAMSGGRASRMGSVPLGAEEELAALQWENARLAHKLQMSNCENFAICEQVELCKKLLIKHNVKGAEKILAGRLATHSKRHTFGQSVPSSPESQNMVKMQSRRYTVESLSPSITTPQSASTKHPNVPTSVNLLDNNAESAALASRRQTIGGPLMQERTSFRLKATAALLKESLKGLQRLRSSTQLQEEAPAASPSLPGTSPQPPSTPPPLSGANSPHTPLSPAPRRSSMTTLPKPAIPSSRNSVSLVAGDGPKAWALIPGSPYGPDPMLVKAEPLEGSYSKWNFRKQQRGLRDLLLLLVEPIPHNSSFRQVWDSFMLLCLSYIVIFVPYRLAFSINSVANSILLRSESAIEAAFVLDIAFNFRTTFTHQGKTVTSAAAIAKNYAKSWLSIDALSAVPVNVAAAALKVGSSATGLGQIPVLIKLLKLNTLVKLPRLFHLSLLVHKLEALVPHRFLRIIKFFFLVVLISHVTACLFYFSAVLNSHQEDSWPYRMHVQDNSNWFKYWLSMYWAVQTLCKVGYGDVVGGSPIEQIYAMASVLIGSSVFAYFMGNMSVLAASLDQEAVEQQHKHQALGTFLLNRRFPKELRKRIRDYYNYLWRNQLQVAAGEDELLNALNGSLRTDVVLYMYREMVEKVPFFHGKHPQFISALVMHLRPEIYGPGDFVCREGDIGHDMYFVVEGTVHVLNAKEGVVIRTLRGGEYFGELSLVTGQRRSASCCAEGYCELYSLSKEDLENVLQDWPDIAEKFHEKFHQTYLS